MKPTILGGSINRSIRQACLASIVAIVTGCATQSQTQASIGAGIGCAAGAALAKAMGKPAGSGCVVGAAVGGTAGYLKGRQADLELARAAAQDIQRTASASGSTVQVNTRTQAVPVDERAAMGNATQIETVDKMVVNVPKSLVARRDPRAAETFGRVGNYVSTASVPSVVTIKTDNESEFRYIVSQIQGGYSPGTPPAANQVQYRFEPSRRGSQASVEVAHSA